MERRIPILKSCTLSPYQEGEMLIERLSDYLREQGQLVFPHRHNFYHLVLFTQGAGKHAIDFHVFDVHPGQVYLMAPGQIHTWQFEGNMEGFVVNFPADYFQSFLLKTDYLRTLTFSGNYGGTQVLQLDMVTGKKVVECFEQILQRRNRTGLTKGDTVKVMLLYVLTLLEEQVMPEQRVQSTSYYYTILTNFQALVDQHFTEWRLPKEYAAALYITPNYLNTICREHLGVQAGEVIRRRILLEAKRLLVVPDFTITEISNILNFNDNSYFTKFFKKATGLTPEEFRKENTL